MDALPPSLPNAALPQAVPAGQVGLAILLAELTQALAKLPAGTQIPALVTAILPQTQPQTQTQTQQSQPQASTAPADPMAPKLLQLATPDGPAQVRAPANLQIPVGAKLDISIAAAGPQPQWRLTAIDGKPVTPAPLTVTSAPPPVTAPTPAAGAVDATSRPPAAPVPGIPATLVTSTDPTLPSGTTLLVRITNLVSPPMPEEPNPPVEAEPEPNAAASPTPTATPATAAMAVLAAPAPAPAPTPAALAVAATPVATQAPATPSAAPAPVAIPAAAPAPTPVPIPVPIPTAASQPPAQAPVPISEAVPMTIPSPTAAPVPVAMAFASTSNSASTPTPTAAPSPPLAEIGGEVLPNNDAGRPLVKTSVGLLALTVEPQSAPPAGTHVTLEIIGKPAPPAAPPLPPLADDMPDKALPRRLTELVEKVQASGNDKLAEAVRQAIPTGGPKLAAQLLAVIASTEPSQGLPRWLGESLAIALTHSAPEAMTQLSRQWEALSQPVQGPDNGEWRTLLLPLMMGGQVTLLRLTTRDPRRGAAPADREKGTRFLLDLDLSLLGPMQFDGLVKRQYKHFDLIIRTRDPLPGEMRRDIDSLFLNGLMNFGLQGSVVFQPDGRFVEAPPLTGAANGIIFA